LLIYTGLVIQRPTGKENSTDKDISTDEENPWKGYTPTKISQQKYLILQVLRIEQTVEFSN